MVQGHQPSMGDLDSSSASLLLSTKPTVTQHWRGTIRQSGKLVRELCSTFTMYAEKIIYTQSGINNGYSYAPYFNMHAY